MEYFFTFLFHLLLQIRMKETAQFIGFTFNMTLLQVNISELMFEARLL